jgi:DNA mismatch repair ATPase MutS
VESLIEDQLILQIRDNLTVVQKVLSQVGKLDIGIGIVTYIRSQSVKMTRPVLIDDSSGYLGLSSPTIYLKAGHNPLILKTLQHPVPNDVFVDLNTKLTLVNGPNGSGKTTLLRMLASNVILAQIGCHVPAEKFAFCPF